MRAAIALVTVALVAALVSGMGAQQPPQQPTFRLDVDIVQIDTFVADARGNPVTDLTADDFEILEDGKPQSIASFSLVNIPIERAERPLFLERGIEPDVQTNEREEGRIYLIALDIVGPTFALRARQFLRRFIEQHFSANDVGAVVFFGYAQREDMQDFTSSPRLLLNAIDKFTGGRGGGGGVLPLSSAPAELRPPARGVDVEAIVNQRQASRSFREVAEFMATIRGRRKAMVYVTQSAFDVFTAIDNNGGVRSLAAEDTLAAVRAATRGNVTIYPIDPRGLTTDGDVGDTGTASRSGPSMNDRMNLRMIGEMTGGFAFISQNDFGRAFARIAQENSTYYMLGYTSTNDRRDGRYRKVQVRVKRPGLQVRSREGYVAPRGFDRTPPAAADAASPSPLSEPVRDAIASALAVRGLPIRVFAAPYKAADREASVALAFEIDAAQLDLVEKDGTFTGKLEVNHLVTDGRNQVRPGEHHVASLALNPDTYEQALQSGIRVLSETRLPPGRYQLRVAAGNRAGKAGSVIHDVEVPDFSKEPLVLSGVSLTSTAAARSLTIPRQDPLRDFLPGPVTATRQFTADDTIALFVEAYENLRNTAAHTLDLRAELRADDGRVLQTVTDERSSRDLQGASGGYGFTAEFPLSDLAAGLYVIHVEVRANIGERPNASRDVLIRVR